MNSMKIELLDNDHVVRAKTDVFQNDIDDSLRKLVLQIKEEFVAGETAFLEIEGSEMDPITLEISYSD